MKIDRRLNLVLEVEREDGGNIYVHSTPISRPIYEANFLVLSKTLSAMYAEGLAPGLCARVAMLMLRQTAESLGKSDDVERNLLPEIWRLTNVLMPSDKGWETVPFQEVIDRKILGEDDVAEVQNHLCFFTCASWIHRRQELKDTIYPMLRMSGAQIVLLNCTEFAASLPTSTQDANTGETAILSSIPV